jgi:4-hydroxy-tetrahydrodipicolinate synthase
MDFIRNVVNERGDESFPILIGPEMLLGESMLLGCNGGICGGANLYPTLYVKYYQAALEKNFAVLDRTQEIFRLIQSNLYEVAHSPMGIVIGLKYLLWKRGLCSDQMAMPVYEKLSTDQILIMETLDNEIKQL